METKPGLLTSEFIVTLLSVVSTVLAMVLDKIPQDSKWSLGLGCLAAVITYVISRLVVKTTSIKASALTAQSSMAIESAKAVAAQANPTK